jgi:hypothetical protein
MGRSTSIRQSPLPSLPSDTVNHSGEEGLDRHQVGYSHQVERRAPLQPDGSKPREIMIRCAGSSKPWIIWLEIVFIEWSKTRFSVYTRNGEGRTWRRGIPRPHAAHTGPPRSFGRTVGG